MADVQRERALRDELVLLLRARGLTFQAIASQLGMTSRRTAGQAHERALARLTQPRRQYASPDLLVTVWAAGFFDGEGCVYAGEGLQQGRYRRFTFSVSVAQIVRDPLDELTRHWGGSVRFQAARNPRHADQWQWAVRGQEAARFLTDVLPYLRVKREVAQAALPCFVQTHRTGQNLTESEIAERRAAIAIVRSVNRRGREVA